MTFHKLALTFLLTAGPFRLACHATVKPACGEGGGDGERPTSVCCAAPGPADESHARTTRSSFSIHVSHLQALAKASSCETMTSAPG